MKEALYLYYEIVPTQDRKRTWPNKRKWTQLEHTEDTEEQINLMTWPDLDMEQPENKEKHAAHEVPSTQTEIREDNPPSI